MAHTNYYGEKARHGGSIVFLKMQLYKSAWPIYRLPVPLGWNGVTISDPALYLTVQVTDLNMVDNGSRISRNKPKQYM